MKLFRSVCLALAFAVSISISGAGAAAHLGPKADASGTIVFNSDRDGDFEIYAVNPDGTGLTQLTHNGFENSSPIPSPDGKLIAFYSGEEDRSLMRSDGSGRHSLRGCSDVRAGAWSPDSTRLVCEVGYHDGLAIADAATGASTPLTQTGTYASWSPDGSTIAYIDNERLWSKPVAGGPRRRMGTRKIDEETTPSWSPDSQRLAYIGPAGKNDREDLFTIQADGTGERRVAQNVFDFEDARWSPDGSLIAFVKSLPHYVSDVFTVRPDGTGLHRVGTSQGGESARGLSWSADGTTLLYARWRYRDADATDIFVTTLGTGEARAVTQPFPAGGTNGEALWMPGPPLTGVEPTPETITLPLTRKLTFAGPIGSLATDGRRAIPFVDAGSGVLVWDPIARRTMRTPRLCAGGVVLAGSRLAGMCSERGNTYLAIELETLLLGARRPAFVTETYADDEGRGETIGSLVGHGDTIAFTSYHGKRHTARAWLLVPRHGSKCPRNSDLLGPARSPAVCRRLKSARGGATAAVDAGRVLTISAKGVVRLLSTRDRLLRTWKLGRGIVAARLRGRAVAVQHRRSVDIYDTATGATKQTLPLASDGGSRPYLLDIQGDLVVYATGGAIHLLRPSDGRDVALDLPGAAPWLDARLEPSGLFVTWNQMFNPRPGRMAFVPMRTVIEGFDREGSSGSPSATGFAPATSYAAGDGPVSVAIDDVNGDGNPDLATANLYTGTFSVLLSRGDGTFGPKRDYRTGGDPRAVAVRDLNGDGKLDAVTVSSDASVVAVRLNRGDGTFQTGRRYPVGGAVALGIGDLNGDGVPDVVSANRTSTVSVFVNKGNGRLRGARLYPTGLEPVSVALGDLNGDAMPDLVAANLESNSVSVLMNRGNGAFEARRDYKVGHSPAAVSTSDLNNDGRPDIVSANLDANTVSVLLNEGDGTFQAGNDYPAGGDPRSLAIGDVDGDGSPDIATVNAEASTASVLAGDGHGSFKPVRDYATGRHPVSLAIGDLNRDGRSDLATADLQADTVSVLLGTTVPFCTAPNVIGATLPTATRAIEDAHCRVGTVSNDYSDSIETGSVSVEHPRTGTTLPVGSAIDLVLSDGPDPESRGLLLWNRLGSARQVRHSAYGPNLTFFDCRDRTATTAIGGPCSVDVRGKLRYVRGVHGRAATVAGRSFATARVHTAVLRKSILNPEHGAVEAWYRQRSDPVPFEHNPHRIFGGPYTLTGADEVMLFSQDRLDSGDPRLHFELFFGQEPPPFVPAHFVSARSLVDGRRGYRISRFNGRWIHIAGVWDRQGIAGTGDTVRLYVNGKVVARSKAKNWGTTPCARRVSARPAGACFTDVAGCNDVCAGTFAVDDLKIWDYAKTRYGGRS